MACFRSWARVGILVMDPIISYPSQFEAQKKGREINLKYLHETTYMWYTLKRG